MDYERKQINKLREQGWYVIKSAGSHGIADLIALKKETGEIKLVQCKCGLAELGDKAKNTILEPLKRYERHYNLKAELM